MFHVSTVLYLLLWQQDFLSSVHKVEVLSYLCQQLSIWGTWTLEPVFAWQRVSESWGVVPIYRFNHWPQAATYMGLAGLPLDAKLPSLLSILCIVKWTRLHCAGPWNVAFGWRRVHLHSPPIPTASICTELCQSKVGRAWAGGTEFKTKTTERSPWLQTHCYLAVSNAVEACTKFHNPVNGSLRKNDLRNVKMSRYTAFKA